MYVIIEAIYTDLWVLILEPSSPQAPLNKPGLPVQGPSPEIDPFTHLLSFPFYRNATRFTSMTWRQTTTDRIWGNAALPELLLRLVNQNCLASGAFLQPGQVTESAFVSVWIHACKHVLVSCTSSVIWYVTGLTNPFNSHQKYLSIVPPSLSVQTFYCINLLKHFRMFSGVIWERDSQQQNTVLLRLALPFSNMHFIFIPTETLYARVGKYSSCFVVFFCWNLAEWHQREWYRYRRCFFSLTLAWVSCGICVIALIKVECFSFGHIIDTWTCSWLRQVLSNNCNEK